MSKPYELVVYGATGYTGRLSIQHLAADYPQLSYAIAGRNASKLEALKDEFKLPQKVKIEIADAKDNAALKALISKTRTFANLAGPYRSFNGSEIYKMCAEAGVNYVDLAGDLSWTRAMMQKHNDTAEQSGALMISSTGLDCLPSDILAMLAVEELRRKDPSCQPGKVVAAYEIKGTGGMSGGTLNSILERLENPPKEDAVEEPKRGKSKLLGRLPDGSWASFWPFGPNNAKFVHRTADLLAAKDSNLSYGPDFAYEEHWKHPSIWSALKTTATFLIGGLLTVFPLTRPLIRRYGPQSGEGPDVAASLKATFTMEAWATSSDGKTKTKVTLFGKGHPGYSGSAKMTMETALALSENRKLFPPAGQKGGVLTPAIAMGNAIVDRLEACGDFRFVVE